jgi:hypothetical protein
VLALIAVCVTCDASTALRPPDVRPVVLRWASDTVIVIGGRLEVEVAATVDGDPYASPRLRFSSSDTSIVALSPDGRTLDGRRLGRATITVRLLSTTIPSPPTLVREVLVSPAGVRLTGLVDTLYSLGDTLRLRAAAVDANDQPVIVAGVSWTSSDTSVLSVDAHGLVTARRNGAAIVRAGIGAQVDSARVHVWQRPARLQKSLTQVTLDAFGADTLLSVSAQDARGGGIARSPAPAISWSMRDAKVATVTDGRVVAVGNGVTYARVAVAGVEDSIRVEVLQRATRVVIETPSPLALPAVGEKIEASARSYDRRDNEVKVARPRWRTLGPLVAHVEAQTGVVTALAKGEAQIVAEQDGASDTLAVVVRNLPAQVVLEPASVTMTSVGDTLAMRVVVRNIRGVEIAGAPVTLTSTDQAIVRILTGGRILAATVGSARVIATADSGIAADTARVTVVNAVENVTMLTDIATLASVGDTLVPLVVVRSARGTELPRSAAVWTSDDAGTARVTANGVIIAMAAGETVVRAASPTAPDRRDSVIVTVTNAPASVVLDRDADTLVAIGAARTYSAEVRNSRFALLAVAPSWRSLDPGIARVSATGLATAIGVGAARVVATAGAVSDTLVLTVRDEVAVLDLAPSAVTLTSIGDVMRPVVSARNAIGMVVVGPQLTWQTTDPNVARMVGDTAIQATGAGTARVVASAGRVADTMTVTVSNLPVLVDIPVAADTIHALGDSTLLPVTIRNARGDLLPPSSVTWSVDDVVVARVSATGMVVGRAVGTTWVRATGSLARDSALVTVANDVASLAVTLAATGAPALLDTMTAPGQSLAYAAVALNTLGRAIPDLMVQWRSTSSSVAVVAPNGIATAQGVGSALVIARAGGREDTVRVVVVDPTRLYVDNSVVVPSRFGTIARPYATIQDAVNAAGSGDTVVVRRGNGYSEAVVLGRRVTLLGDSAAFVAGGRNPALLPRLGHDLGSAGITTSTAGASYTIRYLAIQHSVDGDAVAIRDADNVLLDHVYVNPMAGFRTGRGLLVERATGSVLVARGRVDSVFAYGVRIVDATNVRVEGITVRGVGARLSYTGAGIEIVGGLDALVTGAVVRRTAGPQVLLDRTTNASLLASTLTGEQQLVRLTGVAGTTVVRGNSFDARRQVGEAAPARSGSAPDPSSLEIVGSGGVLVDANTFADVGGQTSLMDGVRLTDVRAGSGGAPYGALLTGNRFGGGRHAVWSGGASFTMRGSRVDSAAVAVMLSAADTVALDADTLALSRVAAVQSSGPGTSLAITTSLITGGQRAAVVSGAGQVTLRHNTVSGAAGVVTPQSALGAIDVSAANVEMVRNTVTGVRGWSAIHVRGGIARVDSNYVSRNLVGVRVGAAASATLSMRDNSLFDNDTLPVTARRRAYGLVNDGLPLVLAPNWWGDARGPQRNAPFAPQTVGDSAIGGGTFVAAPAPFAAYQGAGAVGEVRKLGGDAQVVAPATTAPEPLVARLVDAQGRPLAGASIAFRVARSSGDFVGGARSGSENLITVTSDAGGLASVQYVAGPSLGNATVTATANGRSITFTVTTQ